MYRVVHSFDFTKISNSVVGNACTAYFLFFRGTKLSVMLWHRNAGMYKNLSVWEYSMQCMFSSITRCWKFCARLKEEINSLNSFSVQFTSLYLFTFRCTVIEGYRNEYFLDISGWSAANALHALRVSSRNIQTSLKLSAAATFLNFVPWISWFMDSRAKTRSRSIWNWIFSQEKASKTSISLWTANDLSVCIGLLEKYIEWGRNQGNDESSLRKRSQMNI